MKKYTWILLLFWVSLGISQEYKQYDIGILIDHVSDELKPILSNLKKEIKGVVGEDAIINFNNKNILANEFSLQKTKENYNTLLNNKVDIILAFGTINATFIIKQDRHIVPTILFGEIAHELIAENNSKGTSGIENLTFLVTSQSAVEDLQVLKELTNFEKVGIAIREESLDALNAKENYKQLTKDVGVKHEIISYKTLDDIINSLTNDIDAFYLSDGYTFNQKEIKELASALIGKKIPSFTATRIEDVEEGLMATNQPEENLNQFIRRIALTIDAHIAGEPLAEMPINIELNKELTVNYNTAQLIDVPIKYSLIARTNFVGDFKNVQSTKTYSLLNVIDETLNQNLALKANEKNIDLVEQDVKTAKSNYLPNVSASVSGTHIDENVAIVGNPEFSTAGNIKLEQVLYSESANANINIQKKLKQAQEENYNGASLDAVFNASNVYFNALILKANAQIRIQNLELTKKNLQLAEQNFEAGQSSKTDVLRFRSELAQNTQAMIEAINQLEQGFINLNAQMNKPLNEEIDIEDVALEKGIFKAYNYDELITFLDDPKLRESFVDFLVDEALKNAPEIKSLGYNIEATERTIKLNSTGRFIPTVALQGNYNHNFNQWGQGSIDLTSPRGNYNIGLNVSIPLFKQNQQNINKQTALIQKDQLQLNKENTTLGIATNVNSGVLNLINQISNIELSDISEITAKESLELTQTSYSNGAVNFVQLIDAQNNYLSAQLAKATAVYNFLLNSIQLERYIGYNFLLHTKAENDQFSQRFISFLNNNKSKK